MRGPDEDPSEELSDEAFDGPFVTPVEALPWDERRARLLEECQISPDLAMTSLIREALRPRAAWIRLMDLGLPEGELTLPSHPPPRRRRRSASAR